MISAITVAVVLCGAGIAYRIYRADVPETAPQGSTLTVAARRDLYGDAFNEAVFMRPGQRLTRGMVLVDDRAVDGMVNGVASILGAVSGWVRQLQTGHVRSYALSMCAGAAVVVAVLMAVRW